MNKFQLSLCFCLLFVAVYAQPQAKEKKKPNLIVVLVDDLGYAQKKFVTPNIDRMKEGGIFFSNSRVTTPACSPSRATLLTGKSALDHGVIRHIPNTDDEYGFEKNALENEFNYWKADPARIPARNNLALSFTTYAEALKPLGYYNAFFGKWHLRHNEYDPVKQGFDEQHFVTIWGAPIHFYPPYFSPGVAADTSKTYLTDSLTEMVCDFIKNYNKPQPLQLSLSYYNVHSPFEGRKDWVNRYLKKGFSKTDAEYAAKVSAMDESMGKIMEALEQSGLLKNTVLFFMGDQGGYYNNPPFSGNKMENVLYEGGSRVPFIVYAPGRWKPQIISTPVSTNDVFPTLIALAQGKQPASNTFKESLSLLPLLNHQAFPRRIIYSYRAYDSLYASLVEDKWKFMAYRNGSTVLYNLGNDPAEQNELSDSHPEKIKYFTDNLKKWEKAKAVEQYSPFFNKKPNR